MRLIDADALYKRIPAYVCVPCTFSEEIEEIEKDCKDCVVQRVMNIVDNFPTIDAVEVVRCKDCKWFKKRDWCKVPDWFCADGERKEGR